MKVVYLMLLCSFSLLATLQSQTLAFWPLTPNYPGDARVFSAELDGLPFERGNGIGVLNFSSSGVSATNWADELTDEASVDYYQFGITASAGKTIEITSLRLKERRSSAGPLAFVLAYSKDHFQSETIVSTETLPDNILGRSYDFPLSIKIADEETLLFRLYAHSAESNNGSWTIKSNALELIGSVMSNCSAPAVAPSIELVELQEETIEVAISGGSGQGRLVMLSNMEETVSPPYQGEAYLGNTTYGLGESLSHSSYVITSTTDALTELEIDGLLPGGAYRLSIFEYQQAEMCYSEEPLQVDFVTPCGTNAQPIGKIKRSALDSRVALRWDGPNCFDKYLILASENPIIGSPQGTNFDDDDSYGAGSPANGFTGEVYPVYYGGNRSDVIVTGLSNGTTYYFAAYTLLGNKWSVDNSFSAQPEAACPHHYYERIYINEFHYSNGLVSQDQGVEIAGPAGMDLSNYELVVYQRVGNLNNYLFEVYRAELSGYIDDEGTGLGAVWFPIPDMPDSRGSIRLVNTVADAEADFVDYDPAYAIQDILSPPFGGFGGNPSLLEGPNLGPGLSLQRIGEGGCPVDFQWHRLHHSRGDLNAAQALLPVQLTLLGAESKGSSARIFWQTASEENSDQFLVEHSRDGRDFVLLGKVTAKGFSQTLQDYELYDDHPYAGINYYRLRQVDFDGTSHDHGIVTVDFTGNQKPGPTAFPNPVIDLTSVGWSFPAEVLKLSDAQGRLLRIIQLEAAEEGGARSLDMSNLSPGIYFIRLESREGVETIKILKR